MSRRPTVGIIGGGQLARMTQQAAIALGIEVVVLASPSDESAPAVVPRVMLGDHRSPDDLDALAAQCDIVTLEHEWVSPAHLDALAVPARPGAGTLRFSDKAHQRVAFARAGLPVPPFAVVEDVAGVELFAADHGWPVVLKSATGGYDGYGVRVVADVAAAGEALVHMGRSVAEPLLPLERELAVIVARRPGGEKVVYPCVETVQRDGICTEVVAPASTDLDSAAEQLAVVVADLVESVGVLAVELFVVHGELLINELAPRPHNSGHLTIDGCATSQFENHLRGILDWPLGPTTLLAPAVAMANILGEHTDPTPHEASVLTDPVHVHLYGKSYRRGRKLGHVTALAHDRDEALALVRRASRRFAGTEPGKDSR